MSRKAKWAQSCYWHPKRPAGLCLDCILHNENAARLPREANAPAEAQSDEPTPRVAEAAASSIPQKERSE
jgi:hypothetical protein